MVGSGNKKSKASKKTKKKSSRSSARSAETSRRKFLGTVGGAAAAAALGGGMAVPGRASAQSTAPARPQDPPVKSKITTKTIAEAEKLARIEFTEKEREQIVATMERSLSFYPRLRSLHLENGKKSAGRAV